MNKEEIKAVYILQNCIADYVIGDYCIDNCKIEDCKDKDCIFTTAIDTVVNLIDKQNKMIDLMAEELSNIKQFNAEGIKQYFEKEVSKLNE